MRNITVRPGSALIGAALAVAALFGMGQSTLHTAQPIPVLRVEYVPHPRDYVQIEEGVPYVVPGGRLFVLTGLGASVTTSNIILSVDGVDELRATGLTGTGNGASVKGLPGGLTVSAGSTITVGSGIPLSGRAWGYLADE